MRLHRRYPSCLLLLALGFGAHPAEASSAASEAAELPTPAWRSQAPWLQAEGALTILDGHRRALRGRYSVGASAGYRWDAFGLFATASHDTFVELLDDVPPLRLIHTGVGVEWLWLWGRIRSTVSAGVSTVLSRDGLAERGSMGWFFDVRPSSFRFPLGDRMTLEWAPLTFDVTAPDLLGIPLILPNYMTVLMLEWSAG